ncbi:hypothetical protein BJP34_17425 [Moorena producens PAL-8-15-08-1]|uniref:Cadherin domain-containing protein n=1 Tax=Moorena producens PAL-8-15-08-1 TaxID=1458985 RepID=A0A1D8TU34_9CYAN|nr:Calx-beta domain-containing protein [Moorena producens]AOX00986.1 hypothetical protein BJP34_17425 [Moorena producens PAL-8-15-08-1]
MANVILSQTTIQLTEGIAQPPTYTISLDPPPTQPVTVTLRTTDGQSQINVDDQGFSNEHTVVFSGNLEKTVTVQVNDDGIAEGVHPGTITHTVTATEDEENYPLNTELTPVSLDITDNDPGLYIQGTPTPIEGGENGTYEFGLSTAPDGNVTVEIETTDGQSEFSLDGGKTFVSSVEKTFTPTDFTTEITVQGIEDNILEGQHSSTITHTITQSQATQGQYSQGQNRQVFPTITDNNPDLLTFDNQTLSLEEGQEDGTYTIKADGLDGDITVTIKANGSSLIKVEDDQEFASEQMITLNSTTFEKTITVQAAEDSDVTGPQTVSISHEITNSNSLNFPLGKVGDVTVNIADNDPGVIITQPTGQILEGEENEYTIALSTNPNGPVTITLESDDDSDIKLPDGSGFVEQGTITLSDTTPQTIKVQATGNDDSSEGTPHESTITHTITDTDDTDNYPENTTIDNATIQIIDDSSSLFDFGTASSVEEGNDGNYTLRLTESPGGDVIVTIQADDQSLISIDGGSTFAASQEVRFSDTGAKTITVKPIDDSTVEGAHTSTITHTITDAPDGSDYKVNSKAGDVIVTITDNDPGLIITPATEPTEEGGDLTTYQVALSTTPTSDVTVTITTDGESELALSDDNLNFGTSRNILLSDTTPTTVTVRGTEDDKVEGLHTSTLRHETTDSRDPKYPEGEEEFTTIDIKDGTPGVIISNKSLSVSEGQEGTYTISLTTEPTQDVTVTITADEQGLISVDGEEFASQQVITLNQSTLEKEIKVQAVDDQPPEGIHSSIITHSIASADTNYSNENTPIEDVTATITDNDIGVVIIGTPQVTEGSTDTYEIGLSTQPTGNVKVTITADDETEISIDGTSFAPTQDVTFSDLTLQTITVRGKDDSEFRSLRDSTIKHAISESQDITNYPLDLEIPDVTAEITDDEPGVVIISNLDLTEGDMGTYEIGLNTPPLGGGSVEVTITADPQTRISTDGTNFASSLPIQLRGTTRQTITVQLVDDTAVEGDHSSTISHEITGSSDTTNYPLDQEIEDVTIDITDNDPGLIFDGAIAITEGGEEGTYKVALNTVPTGEVTVTLTADDDSEIKVGEGEFAKEQVITFNPEELEEPGDKLEKEITVQAVDDDLVEGTHTSTISHAVTESGDTTNYPIGTSGSFSATITDNNPGIVFSETTLSAEEGQEDTYTIGLSTVPTSDVTVTIKADDQSLIKVGDGEFAPEQEIILNAETLEKEITVQGLDDDQVEGDHASKISHEIASEDPDYDLGELAEEVTVDITDNDSGLIFSQAITITENNGSGTYTVSLNTPPTGAVQITIQADDQSTISLDGTNFNSQQIISLNPEKLEETITVRAAQDALVEGVHTSTISHTVTSSDDLENYPLGEGPSYTANIIDDDPGIVFIDGPVSVQEGQEGIYTVALSTRPTGDVTVKLTADDQSEIKVDGEEFASEQVITLNAETLEKEITVQPVDDDQLEGDHSSKISYEVTASEDENYTVGLDGELTTNITDPAQVVITPISPLEEGELGEYTIALNTVPAGVVEITITADDDNSEISLDGVTFSKEVKVTLENTTAETIKVQAVDDDLPEGEQSSTISYAITSSGDLDKYPLDLEIPSSQITITDNDAVVPGQVEISEISAPVEEGEVAEFTINLDTVPAGAVEIKITADEDSEISLDGETFETELMVSLTDTSQETIKVKAVDDTLVEGDHSSTISYEITSTGDSEKYPLTLNIESTEITITDNEPVIPGQVEISEISAPVEEAEVAEFTINLDTVPAGAVEIKITADEDSEISLDGESFDTELMVSLTDTSQETIKVKAVDDTLVEGDHSSTISYEITSTGDSEKYPLTLNIESTEITITDNEPVIPGQVEISEISAPVEEAEVAEFTINLDTVPAGAVEIKITADEDSEISLDGESFDTELMVSLTDTSQETIKVKAVDDTLVEGDHSSTISYEITSTGDSEKYPLTLNIESTEITITDNEPVIPGQVEISEISAPVEEAEVAEFTINLDTVPAGAVEIKITADEDSEISLDGESFDTELMVSLTDTSQETIKVKAVDDTLVEGDHSSTISYEITSTGDSEKYPLTLNIESTEITITDNEPVIPGQVEISEISAPVEEAEVAEFTINLDTVPAGAVEIKITADEDSEISLDGESFDTELMVSLTDTSQETIKVKAVDDTLVEGDHSSTISYEITSTGDSEKYPLTLNIESTEITITDNEPVIPGQVEISEISAPVEEAEVAEFTINLDTVPAGAVEIKITADEDSEISLDGESFDTELMVSLTDTSQETIKVKAVDDTLVEGDHSSTISYEITSTGDSEKYPLTLNIESTEITITDNEPVIPGQVEISEISAPVEEAEVAEFTINLDTVPAGAVEIKITADEDSEISLDGESFDTELMVSLTDTSQETIKVKAVDDTLVEGDHSSTISYEITSTGDSEKYPLTLNIESTEITITDNEPVIPGQVEISEISAPVEEGEVAEFTINLDTVPAGAVEIKITADEDSEISLDGETFETELMVSLTDTSQETIKVKAVDDTLVEGDHSSTISYEITSTGDSEKYPLTLNIESTEITITDNEPVIPGQVEISEISAPVEEGEVAEFTINLDTVPAGAVEIKITADDDSEISLDGETFDTDLMVSLSNTSQQTIKVKAVDDDVPEGDHSSTISYEITNTEDSERYPLDLEIPSTEIQITDNDADAAGQVLISEISGLTEGGEPGTYTIALDTVPAGPVEIKIMADEDSEISLDGQSFENEVMVSLSDLTPKTITVMAVDDNFLEGDHNTTISYTITNTGDEVKYPDTLNIPSTEITITDNESVTTTPEIIISESPILFEGGTGIYTVALTKTPTGEVEITIKADDQTEISLDGTTFASEQVLTFNEAKLQTITVRGLDDQEVEGDHESTISHEITKSEDSVNYPLGDVGLVTASIFDNDIPIVTITASDLEAAEKDQDPGSITITRSGDTSEELTVSYMTFGSTATADDYSETLNGSVTIAAGESSVELKITPEIDSRIDEGDETVNLVLNTSEDYNLVGKTFAQITIADDISSVPDKSTRFVWRNPLTGNNILWKIDDTHQVNTVSLPAETDLNLEIQGTGDFDGDGEMDDVFWLNKVTGAIQYWQGQGEEIKEMVLDAGEVNPLEWELTEFADFNGDLKDDILAYKPDTGELAILTIDADKLVNQGIIERDGQALLITQDTGWQIEGSGNFSGGDQHQILWRNQNTGQVGIWQIDGNELVDAAVVTRDDEPVLAPSSTGWQIEGVADFTDDGQEQILWYHSETGQIATWQMSDKKLVKGDIITRDGEPLGILSSTGWSIQGVADVDNDGKYDIVWNNSNTIAFWHLNGSELRDAMVIDQPPEAGFNPNLI